MIAMVGRRGVPLDPPNATESSSLQDMLAMIHRYPGSVDTRSRMVVHDGRLFTVATSKQKSASLYEQTRQALTIIDAALAEAGSSKSKILSATVFITDMKRKSEMNQAWDEWVDRMNPPQRACIGATLEGNDLVEILITAAV